MKRVYSTHEARGSLDAINSVCLASLHAATVTGYTHNFYRYPARFSPIFARAAIRAFTEPGELVFDPFMGGGTALVEARALGRGALGTDISSLAVFISRVKTTVLSEQDFGAIRRWGQCLIKGTNLWNPVNNPAEWREHGYPRNIGGIKTWRLRKVIELGLEAIQKLPKARQRRFCRCVLLRTGQWALDCRMEIPSVARFRQKLLNNLKEMILGARQFTQQVQGTTGKLRPTKSWQTKCLHRSAVGIECDDRVTRMQAPRLILTSPPYPGVHILYHRWQVMGRKETPAPFWVAGSLDGSGASFYNFGDRKQKQLAGYFNQALNAFRSIARIADEKTVVVQLVAFSDPSWQLPKYLRIMEEAGFRELNTGRLRMDLARTWRTVPNRKWYASQKGMTGASKEVVLFHKLAQET